MRIDAAARAVVVLDAGPAEDRGRRSGSRDPYEPHQVVDGRVGLVDEVQRRVDDLGQVVGRDVGGHADRDAAERR